MYIFSAVRYIVYNGVNGPEFVVVRHYIPSAHRTILKQHQFALNMPIYLKLAKIIYTKVRSLCVVVIVPINCDILENIASFGLTALYLQRLV